MSSTGITLTDKNGHKIDMTSSGIVCTAPQLTNTGGITAGQGGSDQVTLQLHTHTQGADSHGDTNVPTNAPTAGT
jgi:hypothetical protein